MALPTTQVSAPGFTQDELETEKTWVKNFNQDADSRDWSKWSKGWADDAFLKFGNAPRVDGKDEIAKYFEPQFSIIGFMHHEIIRLSFDKDLGLIYQTVIITYKIKGDSQGRTIQVPGLAVLHKPVGENILRGLETYVDTAPVQTVVKEVLEGNQANV
ncbi:unnamed protein product [Rhizoctonia solani]|uniref:SnoaL-like domain-containing protein n=1 Tax=Rhizoctonia solani TaxID=456999 RepID=A0A8H3BXA7_9AGAM|nr:unnamed protein product [Rhizoctonia solani]